MTSTLQDAVFFLFSALSILSAAMVIFAKNPIRAVLSLVLCFFGAAGLWLLLEAEFLAITLVLVYVGAVLVLFLFVVMMLDIELASIKDRFARYLPLGILVAILFIVGLSYAVSPRQLLTDSLPKPAPKSELFSHISVLGESLYTDYLYPFILAGVILLVAIIAAISLTYRGRRGSIAPLVEAQVQVTKQDRLRIVKMPTDKDYKG